MRVSAKTDYGLRALLVLAARSPALVKLDALTADEGLPRKFVESILSELRRAGFVRSRRGADGGYGLALPPDGIRVGAVIRVLDGPLAEAPRRLSSPHPGSSGGAGGSGRPGGSVGAAGRRSGTDHLGDLWAAMAVSVCSVLDETTLEHLLTGRLPEHVRRLADSVPGPDRAW